jgi:hypothetical protein
MASHMIVQKLLFPTTNKHIVHVIRRYHKHLHDGIKSDAVSGWSISTITSTTLITLQINISNLTHDLCNTTSLLNNVLTVKTSRLPFCSLSNIFNNSRHIIDRNDKVKGLLCSYFMKTAVFWLSEEISINTFQLQNL